MWNLRGTERHLIGVGGFYAPVVESQNGHLVRQYALNVARERVKADAKPKVCIIPSATIHWSDWSDEEKARRLQELKEKFEEDGAEVSFFDPESAEAQVLSQKQIEKQLRSQDMIVIPGGNTDKMVEVWKEKGTDKALEKAWGSGVVVFGGSAGLAFAYDQVLTDSDGDDKPLRVMTGLGWIKGSLCPHYDVSRRHDPIAGYPHYIQEGKIEAGLAVHSDAMVHYTGQGTDQELFKSFALEVGATVSKVALEARGWFGKEELVERPQPIEALYGQEQEIE